MCRRRGRIASCDLGRRIDLSRATLEVVYSVGAELAVPLAEGSEVELVAVFDTLEIGFVGLEFVGSELAGPA